MRCSRRICLVVLLACLLPSLAFCGWDGFKSASPELSAGSSNSTGMETAPEETPTGQPPMSSSEDKSGKTPTDETLKSYAESSAIYEQKLAETKDILDEAKAEVEAEKSDRKAEKKMEAIEEAKAVVEDLVASKEALDENYNILADITMSMAKDIKRLERQDAFKAGIGLVMGYKYLDTIPLGLNIGFLFNETWNVQVIATYDIHATGGVAQFANPSPENISFLLAVTKYF